MSFSKFFSRSRKSGSQGPSAPAEPAKFLIWNSEATSKLCLTDSLLETATLAISSAHLEPVRAEGSVQSSNSPDHAHATSMDEESTAFTSRNSVRESKSKMRSPQSCGVNAFLALESGNSNSTQPSLPTICQQSNTCEESVDSPPPSRLAMGDRTDDNPKSRAARAAKSATRDVTMSDEMRDSGTLSYTRVPELALKVRADRALEAPSDWPEKLRASFKIDESSNSRIPRFRTRSREDLKPLAPSASSARAAAGGVPGEMPSNSLSFRTSSTAKMDKNLTCSSSRVVPPYSAYYGTGSKKTDDWVPNPDTAGSSQTKLDTIFEESMGSNCSKPRGIINHRNLTGNLQLHSDQGSAEQSERKVDLLRRLADSKAARRMRLRCLVDGGTLEVEEEFISMSPVLVSLVRQRLREEEMITVPRVPRDILKRVFDYYSHHSRKIKSKDAPKLTVTTSRSISDSKGSTPWRQTPSSICKTTKEPPPVNCKCSRVYQNHPSSSKIDSWEENFIRTNSRVLLQLLDAVHYLDMSDMRDFVIKAIGRVIAPMQSEVLRKFLGLHNDLSPEEEKQVRDAFPWIQASPDPTSSTKVKWTMEAQDELSAAALPIKNHPPLLLPVDDSWSGVYD